MFTENTYLPPLQPRVTSSVVDHNSVDEILQFHHHADHSMFSGHFLGYNSAPVYEATDATLLNQDHVVGHNADPADSMENTSEQMQPLGKKDRHSKIFTAQGPRDRRVRLSKGIARKFFDLQEMLGFDKPSKTLDWLLTKSRTAIRELLQTKHKGSRSSSPSECEVLSSAAGNGECFENGYYLAAADSRKKFVKGAKDSDQQQTGLSLARESRAKARERARARTREKMCLKQLNEGREIQYQNDNHFDVFQLSAGCSGNNTSGLFKENPGIGMPSVYHPHVVNETENEGLIQESTTIRRSSAHQQNLSVSRDLMIGSNYSTVPSANATENWDFCSFTASQSNLYVAWDQHRFINSSTSDM